MGLLDSIRADVRKITTDLGDFSRAAIIYDADGGNPIEINIIYSHHHLSVDTDGNPVNEMNAHCSISFEEMTLKGLVFRNAEGEISLRGRIVFVEDKWFQIRQTWPSETVGLAVCNLGKLPSELIPE